MALNRRTFWSHVDRTGGKQACWPWLGSLDSAGRGHFNVSTALGRRSKLARNVAYFLEHGNLPKPPQLLLRTCPTRSCCNPRHQRVCTPLVQASILREKGRSALRRPRARGERNHAAILTEADVRQIIRSLAKGEGGSALAHRYRVTPQTISLIKLGKRWRHLPRADLPH
jgi:hypothetical protein